MDKLLPLAIRVSGSFEVFFVSCLVGEFNLTVKGHFHNDNFLPFIEVGYLNIYAY